MFLSAMMNLLTGLTGKVPLLYILFVFILGVSPLWFSNAKEWKKPVKSVKGQSWRRRPRQIRRLPSLSVLRWSKGLDASTSLLKVAWDIGFMPLLIQNSR